MTRQPWFRMYVEARTDRKLDLLTDAEHRVWFNLLCYAADNDDGERGGFDASDTDLLSIEVAKGDTDLLSSTLTKLIRFRMLEEYEGDFYLFVAFRRRQYDKPSDTPEATAQRKRKQRAREKEEREAGTAPSSVGINSASNSNHRVTDSPVTPASRPVTHREEERRGEESIGEERRTTTDLVADTDSVQALPPEGSSSWKGIVPENVYRQCEKMDPSVLLNWFTEKFPDHREQLQQTIAGRTDIRSQAAYFRGAILNELSGNPSNPIAVTESSATSPSRQRTRLTATEQRIAEGEALIKSRSARDLAHLETL